MKFNLGWLRGVGPFGILGIIIIGICYVMLKLVEGPIPDPFRYACLCVTLLLAIAFLGTLVFMGIHVSEVTAVPQPVLARKSRRQGDRHRGVKS